MFYGIWNNPSGLTAQELLHYLEHVVAHGDGDNVVYASSTPVTAISCGLESVLMEVRKDFGFNQYTGKPFLVDPTTCEHHWRHTHTVEDEVLMKPKHYYKCDICTLVKYEYEVK